MKPTIHLNIKNKTISIALLFYLATVIITASVFLFLSYKNKESTLTKTLNNIHQEKIESLEWYFDTLNDVALTAAHSNSLQSLFKRGLKPSSQEEAQRHVTDFLLGLSKFYHGAKFALLLDSGTWIRGSYDVDYLDYAVELSEKKWYPEFVSQGRYTEYGFDTGIYINRNSWNISVYYLVKNNYSLNPEGVLVMTIPAPALEYTLTSSYEGSYFSLADENGKIILDSRPDTSAAGDDVRYYRQTSQIAGKGLALGEKSFILTTFLDEKMQQINYGNVWGWCFFILLCTAILLIGLVSAFSRYITTPIVDLNGAMGKIRNNQMGYTLAHSYHDEIGDLINGFNEMSQSIAVLIEKNKAISILRKETEYQMLLQQINPHFLYNTLEIINSLILNQENDRAVGVCEALGKIFRYNLARSKWVTVKEEVHYLIQYLLIMRHKIQDLEIYYDFADEIYDQLILRSMLQPLIENAVLHGLKEQAEEKCITLSINARPAYLELIVMDNGSGIEAGRLDDLLAQLWQIRQDPLNYAGTSLHIGIQNVFHRLYLEYGDELIFELSSKAGFGTKITIGIPREENKC